MPSTLDTSASSRRLDLPPGWIGVAVYVLERGYLATLVCFGKFEIFLSRFQDEIGICWRDVDSFRRVTERLRLEPDTGSSATNDDEAATSKYRVHSEPPCGGTPRQGSN